MFPSAPSVYGNGKNIREIKTAAPGRHPDPAAGRLAMEFKGSPSAIRAVSFEVPDTRFSAAGRCESDVVPPEGPPRTGHSADGGRRWPRGGSVPPVGWGHLGVWAGWGRFYRVFVFGGASRAVCRHGGNQVAVGLIGGPGPKL